MWKLRQLKLGSYAPIPHPAKVMYTQRVHKMISPSPLQANLLYSQPEAIKLNFNETHSTYKHRMLPLVVIELFLDLNAFL